MEHAVLPPWISENNNFAELLFGDDKDFAETESSIGNFFEPYVVHDLIARPRVTISEPVRWIFVAIIPSDIPPNPSPEYFNVAVVSICYPNTTIVGLEAFSAIRRQDYEHILLDHTRKLREKPHCRDATIVLGVTARNMMEAGEIQSIVRRAGNVVCMNTGRWPGMETTGTSRKESAEVLASLAKEGEIRIDEDIVVSSNQNPEKLVRMFGKQCLAYYPNKTKGGYLVSAFQDACYFRHMFMHHKEFQHLH